MNKEETKEEFEKYVDKMFKDRFITDRKIWKWAGKKEFVKAIEDFWLSKLEAQAEDLEIAHLKELKIQLVEQKQDLLKKVKRHSQNFQNKYPVKKIGQHHYIRRKDLGYFLEAQKHDNEILVNTILETKNKEIRQIKQDLLKQIEGIPIASTDKCTFLCLKTLKEEIKKLLT